MQANLAEQIKNSLHQGKASASWLIVGPRGIGKKAFVIDLVKDLTGIDNECNSNVKWLECDLTETAKASVQKTILAGKAVEDMDDLGHKEEITIDNIRAGCRFLSMTSDALKILVINLADEMNKNAQNALLKTLEEPYPNTLILLLCENIGKLLPTIKSRCQIGCIREVPVAEMLSALKKKHSKTNPDDLRLIAELSSGSLGTAEKLLAADGIELYREIESLCAPIKNLSIMGQTAFVDKVLGKEDGFEIAKYLILEHIQHLAKQLSTASLDQGYDFAELYQKISDLWRSQQIVNLDKKQTLLEAFYMIGEVLG